MQRDVDELAATIHHAQQPAYYDQIIGEIVLGTGTPGGESAGANLATPDRTKIDLAVAPAPAPVPPPPPAERTPVLPPPLVVAYQGQFGSDNFITGQFQRLDATSWLEVNHESGPNRDNRFSFVEKSRRGGLIELFDDTHEMWIRLDMNSRHIFWSHDKKTWNHIYNITAAK